MALPTSKLGKPPIPQISGISDPGGLGALRQSGGDMSAFSPISNQQQEIGPSASPMMPGGAPGMAQEVPGISGVTPGAIERKLGLTPPTVQAGGMPQQPGMAMANIPNFGAQDTGIQQQDVAGPLQMIQQLIRSRRMGQ